MTGAAALLFLAPAVAAISFAIGEQLSVVGNLRFAAKKDDATVLIAIDQAEQLMRPRNGEGDC